MIRKLLTLLRRKPKPPWVYTGHEYRGVADGCHVYLVSLQRGDERQTVVRRFHAGGNGKRKCDVKMTAHFTAEAASHERGA
jgi:hypothetical protein